MVGKEQLVRILRVITRLNIGGPSIHAAVLSTKLDPERFFTHLAVGESDRCEGDLTRLVCGRSVRIMRVKTLHRPIHPVADARALFHLLRMAWRAHPHIIHTHMAKAGSLGRLAGVIYNRVGPGRHARHRAVLVHTFHGHVLEGYFPAWLSQVFVMIERWLARHSDCLIAVSRAIRDELLEKGIGRSDQWRVIPLGLDLGALTQLAFPDGATPFRVGLVGRLVPVKNPHLFLRGLARLVDQSQPTRTVHGVVVGDGPLRATLEREAAQLGLSHLVYFTGWQEDLQAVYEGLDVTCSTSWNEGTPVSLIEAMAAGRAVVATDVGGVRELLDIEGVARVPIPTGDVQVVQRGILVRAGDLDGLSAALSLLHHDTALRRSLGEAGRAFVTKHFTVDRLLQDVQQLYEHLLQEHCSSA